MRDTRNQMYIYLYDIVVRDTRYQLYIYLYDIVVD